MKKKPFKFRQGAHCRQFNEGLYKPNCTTSLRTILDRVSNGLPSNATIHEHVPLPPDGNDMNDFERGTEEILDLVDAQEVSERVKQYREEQLKKQQDERQKKQEEQFNAKVEEEIARRMADSAPSA